MLGWTSGPDPNHNYAVYWHGYPLPWEQWGHGWNAARNYDRHKREHVNHLVVVSARVVAWTAFPALAAVVIGLVNRARGVPVGRPRRWTTVLILTVFGCGFGGLLGATAFTCRPGWHLWMPERFASGHELLKYVVSHYGGTRVGDADGWKWYTRATTAGMIVGAIAGGPLPRLAAAFWRITGRPERVMAAALLAYTFAALAVLWFGFRHFTPAELTAIVLAGPVLLLGSLGAAAWAGVPVRRWPAVGFVLWVCAVGLFQWRVFASFA